MKNSLLLAFMGPNVNRGEIDAQLGSHLLKNFVDLIYFSDHSINGGKTLNLKIGATSEGSFEFLFKIYEVVQSINEISGLVDIKPHLLVAHSIGLFDPSSGLINLLLKTKGEFPKKIKKTNKGFSFYGVNFGTINVSHPVGELYLDPNVRRSLSNLTTPLINSNDIETLEIRDPASKKWYAQINKNQAKYFQYEENEDSITKSFIRTRIRVVKPDYEGSSKWKVRYENKSIEVKISDLEWLKAFQTRRVLVPPGSWLDVEMIKKTLSLNGKQVKQSSYEVVKIIDVLRPSSQPNLI